jgi:hypothetical protein
LALTVRADLQEQLGWYGPIRFTTAEWRDNGRLVLLRYKTRNGQVADLGIRLDLDKKAFLDDLEDNEANRQIHLHVPQIWAAVAEAYTKTTHPPR